MVTKPRRAPPYAWPHLLVRKRVAGLITAAGLRLAVVSTTFLSNGGWLVVTNDPTHPNRFARIVNNQVIVRKEPW
jgi:hypothetical protein